MAKFETSRPATMDELQAEIDRLHEGHSRIYDENQRLRDENGKLLGLLGACRDNLGGHWGDTELSVESVGCPDAVPARVKEAFDSLRDENATLRALICDARQEIVSPACNHDTGMQMLDLIERIDNAMQKGE